MGDYVDEWHDAGSWNFSDETLVAELHRAIALAKRFAISADELSEAVARMQRQHHRFVYEFGKERDER